MSFYPESARFWIFRPKREGSTRLVCQRTVTLTFRISVQRPPELTEQGLRRPRRRPRGTYALNVTKTAAAAPTRPQEIDSYGTRGCLQCWQAGLGRYGGHRIRHHRSPRFSRDLSAPTSSAVSHCEGRRRLELAAETGARSGMYGRERRNGSVKTRAEPQPCRVPAV